MKLEFLMIIFALFGNTVFAQKQIDVLDTVSVKVDDWFFTVRVAEKIELRNLLKTDGPPFSAGFGMQTSNITCEFLFSVSALKKTKDEAIVSLHLATLDEKKSSSFNKQVKIKRGEKKDLKLKSKLKCMYNKLFSVNVSY